MIMLNVLTLAIMGHPTLWKVVTAVACFAVLNAAMRAGLPGRHVVVSVGKVIG
jgi:hypothetical protein